jgi:hypothetical protein
VSRFEVIGRKDDRELLRTLVKRLAEKGPDANRLRAEVSTSLNTPSRKKGGVLAALLRAPAGEGVEASKRGLRVRIGHVRYLPDAFWLSTKLLL